MGPGRGPGHPAYRRRLEQRRWVWLGIGLAVTAAALALVLGSPTPPILRRVVAGLALLVGGLAVAGGCLHRYRLSTGRRQTAWMVFSLAALAAALGHAWQLAVGFVDRPSTTVSPAQLAFALALALVVVGLVVYPSTYHGTDLARMVLDGVVLGGSLVLIAADTVVPQIVDQPGVSGLARIGPVVAPLFDLVLATVAWLMFLRSPRRDRPTLALIAAAFALFAVSDLVSAVQGASGRHEVGTLVDVGTVVAYGLLAAGLRWPEVPGAQAGGDPEQERSAAVGVLVMFGVLIIATVLHLSSGAARDLRTPGSALLIVVLLSVAARQALLIADNEGLRQDLERRVADRSNALQEVTQRTDLLVDSVGDGVYGVDERGLVTFVNPAAVQVLGYQARELLGRQAHEIFHAHPADERPRAAECYVTSVVRSGRPVSSLEDVYVTKDGERFPVEVTASPLAKDINARGAVVVFRDVTQRQEVDRLKNEFVSMVSHELKTPLTAIRGSLGLLAGGALGELASPATRMVEIAMDSSERLTRMINQILDLERIESGTMPTEIGHHPAKELIESATDQIAILARNGGVDLQVVGAEGIVVADADQVEQTLVNLLGNAVKFSPPEGTVEVEATEGDGMVTFRVGDAGRGIPEADLDAIFTRFHQVDSSDAREKGGTGLGLAISRSIVERLGGQIWAENSPGGGATFRFTLPAAPVDDPSPTKPADGVD
jgi:PAS domain S-box-containing protein